MRWSVLVKRRSDSGVSQKLSMLGLAVAVGLSGSVVACAPEAAPTETLGTQSSSIFFQNATRRDATSQEAARVANLPTSGCTAFFLENSANKVFMGTARHCFQFAVTDWCQNDGVVIDNFGAQGRCTRVIAGDRQHDITVIEVNIQHASTGDTTLRLGKFLAPVQTPLIMTGYPQDQDPQTARQGRLTTTENCWTLTGIVPNEHVQGGQSEPSDKWQKHNCSTYGGNSGGPMYIQGTRNVIGLPSIYLPDDYRRLSATDVTTAAGLDLMLDFVTVHEAALKAAGISIAASADEVAPQPDATQTPDETDGDSSDDSEEEEEETPKKKKKAKPAASTVPVAQSGCSAAPAQAASGGGALAGLVLAGAVLARRRRRAV